MDIKLDKIDRKILYELDLNARLPETQLAKKVGRSRESIRYRINQLKEKGVISNFSTLINLSKLGYQGYKMYLKLGGKHKERKELYEFIKKQENLFWLGIGEGAWDVGMTFFAKTHSEFHQTKNIIFSKFKHIILRKDIGVVINVGMYPKKYFLNKKPKPFKLFGDLKFNQIDDLDKKIINLLQENARISLVHLANQTQSTIDIIRNRIKKLEKKEIILRYHLNIDYNRLGLEFFKVFLYFSDLPEEKERKLIQFFEQKPEILNFVRQILPWDMEIEVMVENYSQFNQILRETKDLFSDVIINTETAIMSEDYIFPVNRLILQQKPLLNQK